MYMIFDDISTQNNIIFCFNFCFKEWSLLERNICWFFHISVQFLFITSKTELDFYHQSVNAWVAERLKSWDLKKLGIFKKFLEMGARSLAVSDLRSETKGCRFESGC